MNTNHQNFLQAIENQFLVEVTFISNEKGLIKRLCVPFDYGPSKRYHSSESLYHFFDIDSPEGGHTLSISPDKVSSIIITNKCFNPRDYIHWTPNWYVSRSWGVYS